MALLSPAAAKKTALSCAVAAVEVRFGVSGLANQSAT